LKQLKTELKGHDQTKLWVTDATMYELNGVYACALCTNECVNS